MISLGPANSVKQYVMTICEIFMDVQSPDIYDRVHNESYAKQILVQ